jgi:hypothetical protein
MRRRRMILPLCVGLAVLTIPVRSAWADVHVNFRFGYRDRPLRGWRYEKMRRLAHYMGETADHIAREVEYRGHRPRGERLVDGIVDFARRAQNFHERMDTYTERPWDLPDEVTSLRREAERWRREVHNDRVFFHTFDDWNSVVSCLDRMEDLLRGRNVELPPEHSPEYLREYRGDHRDHDRRDYPHHDEHHPH